MTPEHFWSGNPLASPLVTAEVMQAMEETWKACLDYGNRPSFVVLPGCLFERARPQRRGRRLLKGYWRIKPSALAEYRFLFGAMPAIRGMRFKL